MLKSAYMNVLGEKKERDSSNVYCACYYYSESVSLMSSVRT